MKLDSEIKFAPQPIAELVKAILDASEFCADKVQPFLKFPEAALNRSRYICATFEFNYFFLHMMNRHALQKLGHSRMNSLQEFVGPLVSASVIKTFYEDRPEHDKDEVRAIFYDDLNRAELGYSNCKELVSSADPFSKEALLSRLAWYVANLCPNPSDKTLILTIVESAFEKWRQISFDNVLEQCQEFTTEDNRN